MLENLHLPLREVLLRLRISLQGQHHLAAKHQGNELFIFFVL